MCPKIVVYQYSWLPLSTFLGLRIQTQLQPLQTEEEIGGAAIRVFIMPSRGRVRDPVGSMRRSGPDNHCVKIPR